MVLYLKSNLSFYNHKEVFIEKNKEKCVNIPPNPNRMCCSEIDFDQNGVIMLSTFVFSLVANVHDRHKAWENPKENIISHVQHMELHGHGSGNKPTHMRFGSHL